MRQEPCISVREGFTVQVRKKLVLTMAGIAAAAILTGCGVNVGSAPDPGHPLVGSWEWDLDADWSKTFYADGTGTRPLNSVLPDAGRTEFTWTTTGPGAVYLNAGHDMAGLPSADNEVEAWSYLVADDELAFTSRHPESAGLAFRYLRAGTATADTEAQDTDDELDATAAEVAPAPEQTPDAPAPAPAGAVTDVEYLAYDEAIGVRIGVHAIGEWVTEVATNEHAYASMADGRREPGRMIGLRISADATGSDFMAAMPRAHNFALVAADGSRVTGNDFGWSSMDDYGRMGLDAIGGDVAYLSSGTRQAEGWIYFQVREHNFASFETGPLTVVYRRQAATVQGSGDYLPEFTFEVTVR